MTRTAIRYTISALAAFALVSAFASSPASAQQEMEYLEQESAKEISFVKKLCSVAS